jgi:cytochrome P450
MGLPIADLDKFMEWEDLILHGDSESDPDRSKAMGAMMQVMGYFQELLDLRRREPLDDLMSAAVGWKIDGQPIPDGELQAFCLLMFMAGLDTVAMQLCWTWLHLATHPADRDRIGSEPDIIPLATEEFLRVYSFVLPSRKVMQDVDWHGCPMKAGDMVLLPLNSATRDDAERPDAQTVILDRTPNPHLAFGAGPHRCLGSHLARQELVVAMEEWHKRIPNYRLTDDAEILEHGGQLGMDSLPLTLG